MTIKLNPEITTAEISDSATEDQQNDRIQQQSPFPSNRAIWQAMEQLHGYVAILAERVAELEAK